MVMINYYGSLIVMAVELDGYEHDIYGYLVDGVWSYLFRSISAHLIARKIGGQLLIIIPYFETHINSMNSWWQWQPLKIAKTESRPTFEIATLADLSALQRYNNAINHPPTYHFYG